MRERVRPVRAAAFFSAPAERGARTASACSSLTGGSMPRPAAGSCADAARAHKRVDTCGFHPLVNHPFPLERTAKFSELRL